MKLAFELTTNLKIPEVTAAMENAAGLALRDTVVAVARESVNKSRAVTGNNRRSIYFGVAGVHQQASGEGRKSSDTFTGEDTSVIDESKLQGAVYSSSGYGGYLETGTSKMGGIPYMKPALDREFTAEKIVERMKRHVK